MPPQISDVSDDEASVASEVTTPVKPEKKSKRVEVAEAEPEVEAEAEDAEMRVESDKEEGDEDDDEPGEDEYVVEKIVSHLFDAETGELKFEIKWEGFEKKSDRTWEPEENLATADKILTAYYKEHGGKEAMIAEFKDKKAATKKRGRASTGGAENGAKRGKKSNGTATTSSTPPAGAEFKPPSGNWEDEVVMIDACEGSEGSVVVFLTWKGGQKTQHPLAQVYKRCPQKMLKFYESHLVFKKNDDTS